MKSIDLNCDMGESLEATMDGTQQLLMPFFTSVNVACGGHAGDNKTMHVTIRQAADRDVAVGAHPGYPDRANFGRVEMDLPSDVVSHWVFHQVSALAATAAGFGVTLRHVKPHGALYNQAVNNRTLAAAIAKGVARWSREVVLVGLAGSPMIEIFREAGFAVAAEAFADRRYEAGGTLRPRKFADALIRDPEEAARQAVSIAKNGIVIANDGSEVAVNAQTICIHSDTPGAIEIAMAVAGGLQEAGVVLRALGQ